MKWKHNSDCSRDVFETGNGNINGKFENFLCFSNLKGLEKNEVFPQRIYEALNFIFKIVYDETFIGGGRGGGGGGKTTVKDVSSGGVRGGTH